MNVHEWPLTAFTILAQMAVGAFVALGCVMVFAGRNGKRADTLAIPALYALGPLMVAGLVASMFHLGTPLNAPNALRHVATSWLAREIVFGAGFAALGFAFALTTWFRWLGERVRTALAGFTAVCGLAFVWVMANVYYGLETVPAWNRWTTPTQFFLSTALLGLLVMALAFVWYPVIAGNRRIDALLAGRRGAEEDRGGTNKLLAATLRWVGIVLTVVLACQLVTAVFAQFPSGSPNPSEYPFSPVTFGVRLALLVAGAGGLGYVLAVHRFRDEHEVASARVRWIVTACFLMVLVSEVMGRLMFYGQMDRIGI